MIQKVKSDFGAPYSTDPNSGRESADAGIIYSPMSAGRQAATLTPREYADAGPIFNPTTGARAPATLAYNPPAASGGGTGGYVGPGDQRAGTNITGGAGPAGGGPTAPAVPAGPAQGGRQWYNALDQGAQMAEQNKYLGGDSDYTAQMGEYDHALNDFVNRITAQKANFDTDAGHATDANNKNRDLSLDQLGQDFGARGMSYSGLFDKSKNLMNDRYTEQGTNIGLQNTRNKSDADNRQADFSAQNGIDRGNARRAALGRMAQQQALTDSQQVF